MRLLDIYSCSFRIRQYLKNNGVLMYDRPRCCWQWLRKPLFETERKFGLLTTDTTLIVPPVRRRIKGGMICKKETVLTSAIETVTFISTLTSAIVRADLVFANGVVVAVGGINQTFVDI